MKKSILFILALVAISGCTYKSERRMRQMHAERDNSFFFKDKSEDMFTNINYKGQNDVFVKEAKMQLGKRGTLDTFSRLLAIEYLSLSNYEYHEMGDKADGKYFFSKASLASKGEYPLPEDLECWTVPRKNYHDLKWAREDFMDMAYNDGMVNDPVNMAKAQVAFDCWLEQQAEVDGAEEAAICRKEFQDRLSTAYDILAGNYSMEDLDIMMKDLESDENVKFLDLDSIRAQYEEFLAPEEVEELNNELEDFIKELEETLETEELFDPVVEESLILESDEESDMEVAKIEETQYNVYFDWNYTKPKNGDKEKLKQVSDNFKKGGFSSIIIAAYTDRSGDDSVNQKVSEKRGETIKNMLTSAGLDESLVTYFAFGEKATPDPDGVRNAEYRKVIIMFE